MITKSAMITICGRPNVGKSTLTNALVGEKIAIVSNKPQTTRNRITAIVEHGDTQFVLLDTPGFHKPRTRLGDYMVDVVNNYRGGRFGFYSAHASNTFTVAIFFSRLFADKTIRCLMIFWALLNCYTRVYLGVHYFGDILVGTCFGIAWGNFLYFIYRKWLMLKETADEVGTINFQRFNKKNLVRLAATILATYCVIFIIGTFYNP